MSQIKANDYEIRFPGNGLMLLGQFEETPEGKEVWDLKHTCPLRAVRSHFRFGAHPHLEKYRAFFRDEPQLDAPDWETELIDTCIQEVS